MGYTGTFKCPLPRVERRPFKCFLHSKNRSNDEKLLRDGIRCFRSYSLGIIDSLFFLAEISISITEGDDRWGDKTEFDYEFASPVPIYRTFDLNCLFNPGMFIRLSKFQLKSSPVPITRNRSSSYWNLLFERAWRFREATSIRRNLDLLPFGTFRASGFDIFRGRVEERAPPRIVQRMVPILCVKKFWTNFIVVDCVDFWEI